jgi:hypothetical protein
MGISGRIRNWLAPAALLCTIATSNAVALQIDMPNGGTSWIEVSSNGCDGGVSGAPGDCAAGAQTLPLANYILPPNSTVSNPGVINAQGTVLANKISLSVAVSGSTDGSAFLWGATGGNFTLHGSGATPLSVTAIMDISGALTPTGALTSSTASWRISSWNFGAVASELNQRVNSVGSLDSGGVSCFFNAACTAGITPFMDQVSHSLMVLPEGSFNLGFFTVITGRGLGIGTTGAANIVGDISFLVSDGFYITGDNGFDSRATSITIPEPAAAGLFILGLAGLGVARRKKKTA